MNKIFKKITALSLAAAIGVSMVPVTALAKTAKKVDLTGDGKADTVKIIKTRDYPDSDFYSRLKIQINGKTAFSKKTYYYSVTTKTIKLANKKAFLVIYAPGDDDAADYNGIFAYKKGRLTRIVDFNKCIPGYDVSLNQISTSKNTVNVSLSQDTNGLGVCSYKTSFTWKNNKFVQAPAITDFQIATTEGDFVKKGSTVTLSTDATSKTLLAQDAETATLIKGTEAEFSDVTIYGKNAYFSLIQNGTTYWIQIPKDYLSGSENGTYFTNTYMAG
ncbi:MAG: hypothetical protein ACI4CS_10225 [Candidatus Weimeria sp.]